jgi:hypothetical protein
MFLKRILVLFTFEKFILAYFPYGLKVMMFRIQLQNISQHTLKILFCIFLCSIMINFHFIWTADLQNGQCLHFPSTTFFSAKIGPILNAVLNNYIPFCIILLLNCLISFKLYENKNKFHRSKSAHSISKGMSSQARVTLNLLVITFSFVILTCPTQTLNTIIYATPNLFSQPYVIFIRSLFTVLSKSYYCINLYFYLAINRSFRLKFLYLLRKILCL